MKKSLLLIGAVLLGMASSFMAMASGRGCYAETRAEGIALCERGMHQKAVEFFVAAKKCSDVPSNNDLDALIAACRSHMSSFSITKLELGNTDVDDNELAPYGQSYLSSELYYLTPRITYTAYNEESILVGVKIINPDGTVSGEEENEFSYTVDLAVHPGSGNTALLSGWGTNAGGSFEAGEYTVEVWVKGKCLATQKCTVIADPEPEPLVWVNGDRAITFTFPKQGGRRYIDVKTAAGIPFDYWGVPSFCKIENVTSKGFDLVCEPNKTPVYRSDFMGVTVNDGNDEARINVEQESYANPKKLLVDGKKGDDTEITANFTFDGGREIFYVETDGPDYDFWGIPGFCTIENKTATSFFLVCEANPMKDERSDYFRVEAGKLKVTIYVNQAGNPNGESYDPWNGGDVDQSDYVDTYMGYPNVVSEPSAWIAILDHMMEHPTKTYSDGSCYKGLESGGQRNGYGAYYWPVKSYFFGEWENGNRNGMGIYIIADPDNYDFTNCADCDIYVGEFKDGQAHGKGTCYNKYGELIYYGDFENGSPVDTYPNGENYSGYVFQIFHVDDSELPRWYFGETSGTDRHGWGIQIWDDYDCCFGLWEEGLRKGKNGQLFMSHDGSEIEMRVYNSPE
ncbi:MAG: hypothetical protein J6X25_02285 [Bacteroidales bacterium]|nr:hypothetical protein [Bacteroidales bacterium]